MNATATKVNDLVVIDDAFAPGHVAGVVFRVTKVNKVTVDLEPVTGGRGVRTGMAVRLATDEEIAAGNAAATVVPLTPLLAEGNIVTVTGSRKIPADALYVVLRVSADAAVNLVKVGGDGGRYWSKVPASMCTIVDPARITLTSAV